MASAIDGDPEEVAHQQLGVSDNLSFGIKIEPRCGFLEIGDLGEAANPRQ
jgi:hypothetical protein